MPLYLDPKPWPPRPRPKLIVTKQGYPDYPWIVRGANYYANVRTFEDACKVVRNAIDNGWFLGYPIE